MKTSVKYKVIHRHRKMYSISEMCRFFGVSRSGYYGYVKRMEIPAKDLPLAEKIRECQAECRSTYGYRRVHIWLERHGIHQNPKRLQGYTLEQVRQKLAYVRRSQNPILMLLSSGEKNDPVLWRMVLRRNRARQNIDTDRVWENVVLHGSCVVFSEKFLNRLPEPFYPGTFMYFEMEILDWLCRQCGAVTVYDPSVKVLHQQHAATRVAFRSIVSRSRFVACCLEDSLCAAERLMGGESGEDDEDAAGCAVPT